MLLLPELDHLISRGYIALNFEMLVLKLHNGYSCQDVCDPSITNKFRINHEMSYLKGDKLTAQPNGLWSRCFWRCHHPTQSLSSLQSCILGVCGGYHQ